MTSFLKSPLLDKFEDAGTFRRRSRSSRISLAYHSQNENTNCDSITEHEIEERITRRKKSSIRLSISSSDLLPSDVSDGELMGFNEEPLITPSILPPKKHPSRKSKGTVSTRTAYANVRIQIITPFNPNPNLSLEPHR